MQILNDVEILYNIKTNHEMDSTFWERKQGHKVHTLACVF